MRGRPEPGLSSEIGAKVKTTTPTRERQHCDKNKVLRCAATARRRRGRNYAAGRRDGRGGPSGLSLLAGCVVVAGGQSGAAREGGGRAGAVADAAASAFIRSFVNVAARGYRVRRKKRGLFLNAF